jgi:hypothetical protein
MGARIGINIEWQDTLARELYDYHATDRSPERCNYSVAQYLAQPGTVSVIVNDEHGDIGFALFLLIGDGVYEGHTFFGTQCRGDKALKAGRDVFDMMFTDTGSRYIIGAVPQDRRDAAIWYRKVGMVECGFRPEARIVDGEAIDELLFHIDFLGWATRHSGSLDEFKRMIHGLANCNQKLKLQWILTTVGCVFGQWEYCGRFENGRTIWKLNGELLEVYHGT